MQDYYKDLTKRQLFKAYRDSVTHLNECNTSYNTGHDFIHGDPILRVQREAQTEWYAVLKELNYRFTQKEIDSIPNVDALIPRFKIDQRRDFIRDRKLQQEKTSLENTIARFKVGAIIQVENYKNDISKYLITGNYKAQGQEETTIESLAIYEYENKRGSFTGTTFRENTVTYLLENNYKIV